VRAPVLQGVIPGFTKDRCHENRPQSLGDRILFLDPNLARTVIQLVDSAARPGEMNSLPQ